MSNTKSFAERELDILLQLHSDPDNPPIIEEFREEILALCEKFGNSGQSGGSAPYVSSAISGAIKKLCMQQPIAPLTGLPEEWNEVDRERNGKKIYQNNRCSGVFKEGEDGQAYYVDGIVKRCENGSCWNGSLWLTKEDYLADNKDRQMGSRGYIKSFPFTPKTFYVDVIEEEVKKDDWEMYLKDFEQLREVFEYYDMPEGLNIPELSVEA
jgi:hypothetical protein